MESKGPKSAGWTPRLRLRQSADRISARRADAPHWRRDVALLVLAVIAAYLYLPLNHAAHPHIARTTLDRHLPFWPVFAVPYLLFLPIFWLTLIYALVTQRRYRAFVVTVIIVYVVSAITYALYQTYVPRPAVTGTTVFSDLVRFVYAHDHPYNDLPSEHASSAAMFAIYLMAVGSRWRVLGLLLAVFVVLATLFIHQHFLPGALSGVALGSVVSLLAYKYIKR